ncbi:unnamed protein product [Auanema sp. JU1783]|nr:unnamed protein product [Auanema sp. JU1783]
MTDRMRRRRSRDVRLNGSNSSSPRDEAGLSPSTRLRIAADVHRHSTSDDDSGCILEEYAWWPSGLKPDMVHLYFSCLPEDKVPYVGSVGEKWRARQLRHQMPAQDSDGRYCAELTKEEQEELRVFDRARKSECIGVGRVYKLPYDGMVRTCQGCFRDAQEGEVIVESTRTSQIFHPQCFHCNECRILLVDLVYFAHDGKIFCGRHHAEQIKPRCARCDELIFGEECTEAEGRTWHLHHFQCADCACILGGKKYMQRNGKPVCLNCFHSAESPLQCTSCRGKIRTNHPHISQNDLHWHADVRCFSCCVCSKNLLGLKYSLLDNRLYCGFNGCESDSGFDDRLMVPSPERRNTRPPRVPRALPSPVLAPRPPQRAPPPPPTENIYETVLPCTSSSPEFEKKFGSECERIGNYYSHTPNRLMPHEDDLSTSSESEDDDLYVANLMAAASLNRMPNRKTTQFSTVRVAKKKKSNRCIVS